MQPCKIHKELKKKLLGGKLFSGNKKKILPVPSSNGQVFFFHFMTVNSILYPFKIA